jgi:zinc transport system substrate-binding protein
MLGVVVLLVCAGACGRAPKATGRVDVVASFYPLAEAAARVGGGHASVRNLTPPGAEPHDLELDAGQVAAIQDARLVIVLGFGFQPAVEKAARGRSGTVELLGRLPIAADDAQHDPHVWLDPVLMSAIVDDIAADYARVDAPNASSYRANADAFKAELGALDGRYKTGLATCDRHEIVTSHEAFGWLARRYGLTQESVLGISPDVDARLAEGGRDAGSPGRREDRRPRSPRRTDR